MIKIYAIGAALAFTFGSGYKIGHWQRDSAALLETEQVIEQLQSSHVEIMATVETERDEALELAKELQNVGPRIVYRDIKTVVENSNCDHLGDGFVELFDRMHETGTN